jgi:hypothetical protein
LDFVNTGGLREVLRAISSELIHDGDVFAVRSSGPSSLSIDITSDRRRLEAIKNISGNGLKASDILRMADEAEVADEVRYRAIVALFAAYRMVTALEHDDDRRTALIYVSNGYSFDLSPSSANPRRERGTAAGVGRPADHLSALTSMANRSNVKIFAIDPRSLAGAPSPDPDVVVWDSYWTTARNSLRVISEQTGGFAPEDGHDLVETLARIRSAMRE